MNVVLQLIGMTLSILGAVGMIATDRNNRRVYDAESAAVLLVVGGILFGMGWGR